MGLTFHVKVLGPGSHKQGPGSQVKGTSWRVPGPGSHLQVPGPASRVPPMDPGSFHVVISSSLKLLMKV